LTSSAVAGATFSGGVALPVVVQCVGSVEIGLTWSPAVSVVAVEDLRRARSLKPARVSPVHSVQFGPLRVPVNPTRF